MIFKALNKYSFSDGICLIQSESESMGGYFIETVNGKL
jgi:hypothetical protein